MSSESLRLAEWFSDALSVVSDIKSIATASPGSPTTSASQSSATDGTSGATSASSASPATGATASTGSSPTSTASNSSSSTSSSASSTLASSVTSSTSSTQSSSTSSATSAQGHLNGSSSTSSDPTSTASSATSSGVAAASSSAAATHHHHSHTLAIVLGSVLGALSLILLALLICCCLRRRRSRQARRTGTPEDDEVDAWRGADRSTQPMMADVPRSGSYSYNITGPPSLSQHPAYRGMETGSSNPFVPVVPPPRRSAPNAKPGLTTESVPGQDAYTTSPKNHHHHGAELAAACAAGVAAGAATSRISRKPVGNGSPSRLNTSDLPEPVSPTEGSPNRYQGFNHDAQSPVSPIGGYGGGFGSDRPPSYRPVRSPSHQPLMSGGNNSDGLPTRYNQDRPATPFGLMGMGAAGAATGAAMAHHHDTAQDRKHSTTSGKSTDYSRPSYESAAMYPASDHSSSSRHQSHTPPISNPRSSQSQSRSPHRHARFSDPVELGPGAPRGDRRSSGGSNRNSNGPGTHNPSPLRQNDTSSESGSRTDSGDSTWRLSSSMPGAWGQPSHGYGHSYGYPSSSLSHTRDSSHTSYSPGNTPPSSGPAATAAAQKQPTGRRLRLSDLRAQEQERMRMLQQQNMSGAAAAAADDGYGYGYGRAGGRPSYDGYGYGGAAYDDYDDYDGRGHGEDQGIGVAR